MAEKQSKELALKKEMAAARLGYATVNLLNPGVQLSFGQYNNRALNKKAVSDLVHSFRGMGIQHEDHPMPVAVKVDWVDPGCLVQNADDNDLKAVQWTSKVQGAEVTVLGGQHRHAAVQGFKKQLEVEAAKLKTALSKKQKKLNDIGDGGDVTRKGKAAVKKEAEGALRSELADMADKLAKIKSLLSEIGTWTVELYDIGECCMYEIVLYRAVDRSTGAVVVRAVDRSRGVVSVSGRPLKRCRQHRPLRVRCCDSSGRPLARLGQ